MKEGIFFARPETLKQLRLWYISLQYVCERSQFWVIGNTIKQSLLMVVTNLLHSVINYNVFSKGLDYSCPATR